MRISMQGIRNAIACSPSVRFMLAHVPLYMAMGVGVYVYLCVCVCVPVCPSVYVCSARVGCSCEKGMLHAAMLWVCRRYEL